MKKLTCCLFLLMLSVSVRAQFPIPCPAGPSPSENCSDACIFCDFNGLTGTNAGYIGYFFPAFCGTVENDLWIAFVAGTSTGQFMVTPSNCQNGDGLQIALYDKCPPFPPLVCGMGGIGMGSTPVSVTYDGLVNGKTYMLQIDGFAGDVCDFMLTVTPPSLVIQNDPPGPTPTPSGPLQTCPGAEEQYSIGPVPNSGFFTWTAPAGALINGQPSPLTLPAEEGDTVTVTWGSQGGALCVEPGNSCFSGALACINVSVQPIPPTIFPPVKICAEDLPYFLPWGDSVSVSGIYQTLLTSVAGCDSVVRQNVTVKPPIVVNIGLKALCEGECLTVCDSSFCDPGTYSMVCISSEGCDSTVVFNLVTLSNASIQSPDGKSITCAIPEIELTGFPPQNALWHNSQGQTLGNTTNLTVTAPGFYTYSATQSLGPVSCAVEKTVLVKKNTQAPEITASGGILDAAHPAVQLMGHSINQPVQYSWTGPDGFVSYLQNPTVNVPGSYTFTVLNTGNGCSSSLTVNVIQQ